MPELCTSDTTIVLLPLLLLLLLDDLLSFCAFLSRHPLHLTYLVLSLPYLLRLLSFLSPLLFSTSLLLLALPTFFPCLNGLFPCPPHSLGQTCAAVVNIFKQDLETADATIGVLEEYSIMVFMPSLHLQESYQDALGTSLQGGRGDERIQPSKPSVDDSEAEQRPTESCLDNSKSGNVAKVHAAHLGAAEDPGQRKLLRALTDVKAEETLLTRSASVRRQRSRSAASEMLQRDVSMRSREKEWKRTLACKLYEERMTFQLCEDKKATEGDEDMDLLWEAYEVNAAKLKNCKSKKEKAQKSELGVAEECDADDDDEEEEDAPVQFCCLQALKLSTGKMNLGFRKPNLMKLSKVLKGMTIFRVGSGSHGSNKG